MPIQVKLVNRYHILIKSYRPVLSCPVAAWRSNIEDHLDINPNAFSFNASGIYAHPGKIS